MFVMRWLVVLLCGVLVFDVKLAAYGYVGAYLLIYAGK